MRGVVGVGGASSSQRPGRGGGVAGRRGGVKAATGPKRVNR